MGKFDMIMGYSAVQKERKQIKSGCKIVPVAVQATGYGYDNDH